MSHENGISGSTNDREGVSATPTPGNGSTGLKSSIHGSLLRRGGLLDTYKTLEDAKADHEQQKMLLTAIKGSKRALRIDECGAWRITGKHGCIYTWGDGASWYVHVGGSAWFWRSAKLRLGAFAELKNDGHDEGSFRLHQLPTSKQAEILRHFLGLDKHREYNEATLAVMRERLRRVRP